LYALDGWIYMYVGGEGKKLHPAEKSMSHDTRTIHQHWGTFEALQLVVANKLRAISQEPTGQEFQFPARQ